MMTVAGTFNEMYIKYGSMPTLSNYDQSYDNPYSAKQEIIVPDTQPGIYYLMVKNNYHNEATQDITIDANLLGFELLYIDQSRGGNNGELTIKMTGTGFNYGVKPRLIKSGSGLNKTIDAKDTYYTDATELYATFDLRGADQGGYDAVLVQDMSRYEFIYEDMHIETTDVDTIISVPVDMYLVPDSIVTTLPGIFTVEASNNRGSLEYKNIPENVRGGRGFESSIEVTNISNNDMIAPLYMLKVGWNEDFGPIKTKLPGEDSYTPGYKKFLILADEGPAGIIRPGAKGSVRIYATAPAVNEYMRFNMMKIQNSGFEFDLTSELEWMGISKNDPDLIEPIYRLEQEIGNSWEGYNKNLAEEINTFKNKKLHIPKQIIPIILTNVVNDLNLSLDSKLLNINSKLMKTSKFGITDLLPAATELSTTNNIGLGLALFVVGYHLSIDAYFFAQDWNLSFMYLNYYTFGKIRFIYEWLLDVYCWGQSPLEFNFGPDSWVSTITKQKGNYKTYDVGQGSFYDINNEIKKWVTKWLRDKYTGKKYKDMPSNIKLNLFHRFPNTIYIDNNNLDASSTNENPLLEFKSKSEFYLKGFPAHSTAGGYSILPNQFPAHSYILPKGGYSRQGMVGDLTAAFGRMEGIDDGGVELVVEFEEVPLDELSEDCVNSLEDDEIVIKANCQYTYHVFDYYSFDPEVQHLIGFPQYLLSFYGLLDPFKTTMIIEDTRISTITVIK